MVTSPMQPTNGAELATFPRTIVFVDGKPPKKAGDLVAVLRPPSSFVVEESESSRCSDMLEQLKKHALHIVASSAESFSTIVVNVIVLHQFQDFIHVSHFHKTTWKYQFMIGFISATNVEKSIIGHFLLSCING